MTQAIVYGSIPDVRGVLYSIVWSNIIQNPLQFSFPPEVDEDSLMQGAEQLSKAVLQSGTISEEILRRVYRNTASPDPEVVRNNPDLSAQLTSRKERLSWLIHFINDNAVLGKVRLVLHLFPILILVDRCLKEVVSN